MFSAEDSDLAEFKWRKDRDGYAVRGKAILGSKKTKTLSAHRVVLERVLGRVLKAGEICDHINLDKQDCRRENLRLTDHVGNSQNRPAVGVSGIRGVTPVYNGKKWQASVGHAKKRYYLGWFNSPEEAGAAAKSKRAELGFLGES